MRNLRIMISVMAACVAVSVVSPASSMARDVQCKKSSDQPVVGGFSNEIAGAYSTACLNDDNGRPSVVGYGIVYRYRTTIAPTIERVSLTVTPFVDGRRLPYSTCQLPINNRSNFAISEGKCSVPLTLKKGQAVSTCVDLSVKVAGVSLPRTMATVCSGTARWYNSFI